MGEPGQHTNLSIVNSTQRFSESDVIHFMNTEKINWKLLNAFKDFTQVQDDVISDWLNISVRTFRNYKKSETPLKENIKEHIILLFSLYRQGEIIFGNVSEFTKWLYINNFYLDGAAPVDLLNTISGIRFIEDRLIAMEYGDNV